MLTGSIVASGNLTTTGTITAQTLVVQTITSSIVNITGSNIFGSRTTDRQTFTGSLYITGSVGIDAASSFRFNGVGDTSHAVGYDATIDGSFLRGQNGVRFITGAGGGVERMRISSAGTASFTSNALSNAADAATINLKQNSTTANTGIYLERSGEQKGYYMYIGGGADSLIFQRNNAGTKSDVMSLTRDGQVAINTTSTSTESNLFLGAQGTIEGPQLTLQKGTSCACATHLDNFNDNFRVLVGTDTSSNGVHFLIDHKTRNACFYGSIIQSPVVTYAASVSPPSPYTADLRLNITHSSWGGNNDSGTLYVEYQGRAYGNNQTTTAFGVITYRLDSNGVSITNVSTAGVTLSNVTLSTDTSTSLILRVTFAVAQAVDRASIFARTTNSFVTAISADTV